MKNVARKAIWAEGYPKSNKEARRRGISPIHALNPEYREEWLSATKLILSSMFTWSTVSERTQAVISGKDTRYTRITELAYELYDLLTEEEHRADIEALFGTCDEETLQELYPTPSDESDYLIAEPF